MANSEKLGLGLDNPCRAVFLSLRMNKCLERINDRHFWNPGVFSYAMIPRCRLNSTLFFFHRPIYSLCFQAPQLLDQQRPVDRWEWFLKINQGYKQVRAADCDILPNESEGTYSLFYGARGTKTTSNVPAPAQNPNWQSGIRSRRAGPQGQTGIQ
jgi:hypothetical protein